MNTSLLFFKRNYHKYKSIILSLIVFLILFNVIFGFVFAVSNNFKSSVVDNSSLYFMEVYTDKGNGIITQELKNKIEKIDGVETLFCEYPNVVVLSGDNKAEGSSTTLLGVPFKSLKYFGVLNLPENQSDFFYINKSIRNIDKIKALHEINIETARYIIQDNQVSSEPYIFKRNINQIVDIEDIQMFAPDISLIDYDTAESLAKSSTIDGKPFIQRIIVIVPDVSKMKNVCKQIEALNPDVNTRYSLKETRQLPQFAVMIVTMSVFLFGVMFLISILNIRSNIKQLLVTRIRDIALFDILGVEIKNITFVFLLEFVLSGAIAFILAIFITILVLLILKQFYSLDLITNFIIYYLGIDLLFTIVMVIITSYIEIKITERKLADKQVYKEVMR